MNEIQLCSFSSLVCALMFGCGSKTDGAAPLPPSLDSCSAGWQPITPAREAAYARSLSYQAGELYYDAFGADGTEGIEAQPVDGGNPKTVARVTDGLWDMWLMGDQLYYAIEASLWRVAVAGGTPVQLLSHAHSGAVEGDIFYETLSPTTLYWAKWYYDGANVRHDEIWSAPIDGSWQEALFAPLSALEPQELDVFDNELTVAADNNSGMTGVVISLDGSQSRNLARAGLRFEGVDRQGVYGLDFTSATQGVLHQAPVDGGPNRAFWANMPANYGPERLWSDGNGGYLVAGIELFDDGLYHESLFFINAEGNATRTACDPSRESSDWIDARPAFTDDAAYVYNVDSSGAIEGSTPAQTWQIIKIPLR